MIAESLPYMIDVIISLFEEDSDKVIIHGVIHKVLFASGFDQASIPQEAQLVRHRRFGNPHENGQIADAQGPLYQRIQDTRTGQISKSLKRFNQQQEVLFRQSGSSCGSYCFRIDWHKCLLLSHLSPLLVRNTLRLKI